MTWHYQGPQNLAGGLRQTQDEELQPGAGGQSGDKVAQFAEAALEALSEEEIGALVKILMNVMDGRDGERESEEIRQQVGAPPQPSAAHDAKPRGYGHRFPHAASILANSGRAR